MAHAREENTCHGGHSAAHHTHRGNGRAQAPPTGQSRRAPAPEPAQKGDHGRRRARIRRAQRHHRRAAAGDSHKGHGDGGAPDHDPVGDDDTVGNPVGDGNAIAGSDGVRDHGRTVCEGRTSGDEGCTIGDAATDVDTIGDGNSAGHGNLARDGDANTAERFL